MSRDKVNRQLRPLLAKAAGASDDEEARTAAWIACKLIREHGLLALDGPAPAPRAAPPPAPAPPSHPSRGSHYDGFRWRNPFEDTINEMARAAQRQAEASRREHERADAARQAYTPPTVFCSNCRKAKPVGVAWTLDIGSGHWTCPACAPAAPRADPFADVFRGAVFRSEEERRRAREVAEATREARRAEARGTGADAGPFVYTEWGTKFAWGESGPTPEPKTRRTSGPYWKESLAAPAAFSCAECGRGFVHAKVLIASNGKYVHIGCVSEAERRSTTGPYQRAPGVSARSCAECLEPVELGDAVRNERGNVVHGDCVPASERP